MVVVKRRFCYVRGMRTALPLAIVIFIAVAIFVTVNFTSFGSRTVAWDRSKAISVPQLLDEADVRLDDLPAIVEAISHGTADVRFAALTFTTPDRPTDEDAVNLNMSFEDGTVGFDWVLLAPRNIEDEDRFQAFARRSGVEPIRKSMNDVSYLRVEGVNIADFTARIVTDMYERPSTESLRLFYEGFERPQD